MHKQQRASDRHTNLPSIRGMVVAAVIIWAILLLLTLWSEGAFANKTPLPAPSLTCAMYSALAQLYLP